MRATTTGGGHGPAEQLSGFQQARLSWRLFRDPRVANWIKAAAPVAAIAYVIMPIDLIPDVILGIGQLDDLGMIGVAVYAMTKLLPRLAPRAIVDEHLATMFGRRQRADESRSGGATVVDAEFRVIEEERNAGQRRQTTGWGTKR